MNPRHRLALLTGASVLALSGCGGGIESALTGALQNAINRVSNDLTAQATGSPAPAGSTTPAVGASAAPAAAPMQAATKLVFSGTVATGAPLVGATLVVHDATGSQLCTQAVGQDGTYSCEIAAGSRAPFVVIASRDDIRLVSIRPEASSGTVNVTPLTHLIAATLSPSGDPARLVDEVKAAPAAVDPEKVRAAVERVMTALQPLLETLGTRTDPIAGRFDADGTGHDRLLDLLQVSVRPEAGAGGPASNIEVTVRARPSAADAPPVSIAFRSDQQAVPALAAAAVTAAAIPAAGQNVAMLLADFLRRMNACYALPQTTRVTQGSAETSIVQAPQCRTLFVGDDPATYLQGGSRVGPNGAFKGLFGTTRGVTFDRPSYEYMRANGDYVIGYRWTAPDGSTDNEQLVVRKLGDRFQAIGNQYVYDSRVRSFAQWRDLVNAPTFSSISTGYNIWIANRTAAGLPIFEKVEVTTPRGTILTYVPATGMGWLVRARADGTPSRTPVLRLAGRWLDPANTASLAEKEPGLMLIDPQLSDEELRRLPDQSVWTLRFVHRDRTLPDVIQTHRTTSRALTVGEVAATTFAELTPAAREAVRQASGPAGPIPLMDPPGAGNPNWIDLSTNGPVRDFWRVPSGAVAPTSVSVFGRAANNVAFNDSVNVASVARTARIACTSQGVGDTHCAGGLEGQYAVGGWIDSLELWARNARQVEVSTLVGVYRPQ
jgi:hypothetical protein